MRELTEEQRDALRRHVAAEQARAAERVAALQRQWDDLVIASAESVRDDEHDPEGSTIAYERAQVGTLLDDARVQQAALDRAAQRLPEPDADRCDSCGAPIGYERLLARPSVTTCVSCARARL
ncbi:MAG: TraR/DksA family transcriptional regulator [Egibacteraceae bacterium]